MTAPKIFAPEYYARMRALESGSWWSAAMRDTATSWLLGAGLPGNGVMLDVGCGSGQSMTWFTQHWPGWRTIGIDVSRDGLQAARHGAQQVVLGASATDIPLPDNAVDAIVTLDVLQHLPLPGGDVRALAEMRRVLRPGGILFVRTNAQSWPRTSDDQRYNFHKYSPRELRDKLAAAGFRVRKLGSLNALLGLAEIPRELRVRRIVGTGYAGLQAAAPRADPLWGIKHAWLRLEGSLVGAGASLPLGRTILALAHAGPKGGTE